MPKMKAKKTEVSKKKLDKIKKTIDKIKKGSEVRLTNIEKAAQKAYGLGFELSIETSLKKGLPKFKLKIAKMKKAEA